MTHEAIPTMVASPAPPAAAAVQQWIAFIEAMEAAYAPLAAAHGEVLAAHTPAERRAVAELAASLGIAPALGPSTGANPPPQGPGADAPDPAAGAPPAGRTGARDLLAVGQ